ncbi:ubiquitin carboxyl-terminal hydrolase 2 [[Candida] anglica]|uniref:ubiquitinyl hydrolase 1 n=1 Tax=[Candida] anglica TaxID=148631 RepID=A0ABP0EMA6_9ASCO
MLESDSYGAAPEVVTAAEEKSESSSRQFKSNNPFLQNETQSSPQPLIEDREVSKYPFKTLNRILNDIKWSIPMRNEMSILNEAPIVYSRRLTTLAKSNAPPHGCLILNNSFKYAPSHETIGVGSERTLTVIRGLLPQSDKQTGHFEIRILELNKKRDINHPVDKREYHIIPESDVSVDVKKMFANDLVEKDELKEDQLKEEVDPLVITSYFKATSTPNDHFISVKVFPNEFTSEELFPLYNQKQITERYLASVNSYPDANLSPETIPTPINCFNTLLKVLRGPVLIGPEDQTKTININNPSLNSQIDISLLFEKLSFTTNDEELIPPSLVNQPKLRDSYIRKILEIIYLAHRLPGTNDFTNSISFSDNLSLVYRTFNEVNQHLAQSFGNNEVDNQLPFLVDLSVCSYFQDEVIVKCFESTVKSDLPNKLKYVDDLKAVIGYRSSGRGGERLNNYYKNSGLIGWTDYVSAMEKFGLDVSMGQAIDDQLVIEMYRVSFQKDSKNYNYYNKLLKTIAIALDSETIYSFLNQEILPLTLSLEELAIEEVTEDEVVITAYEFKKEDLLSANGYKLNADEVVFLNKALLSVAVNRKSYLLMSYVEEKLPELLQLRTSIKDSPFSILGCTNNSNDFEIIVAYQKKLVETTDNEKFLALRQALVVLSKQSKILQGFIQTGQVDVGLLPPENWPAGLDNIGNTCYLNSLLQYYFCIKPLRDMILKFDGTADIGTRKIGGRIVEESEIIRANQFVFHLKKLFYDMIHSDKRCVQPSKELAFLAFLPSGQPVEFKGTKEVIEISDDEMKGEEEVKDDIEVDEEASESAPIVIRSESPSPIENNDDMDVDSIEIVEKENVPEEKTTETSDVLFSIPSDVMDSTIEMGRQQDVTECIENVTFQIETALEPQSLEEDGEQYDLIKQLFFGKTKQTITPLTPGAKQRTAVERFSSLIINVSDHPNDIYDSLDSYFSEDSVKLEEGEVKKSLTVCELPQVLQFHVQRVLFDRERLVPYKSLEPIPFGETIYVDRYLDTEDPEILRRRNEVFQWKSEVSRLIAKREELTKKEDGQMTIIDTLVSAKRYFEKIRDESNDPELSINPSTIEAIQTKIDVFTQEIKTIDSRLEELKHLVSNQFREYTQVGYSVFAIFIHRGEASYGHYWIYIKDPKRNIFRKYNDETVTEVPLSEVMNFADGNTATPYYIVYVKDELEEEYIEPLKRVIACSH